MFDVNKRKECWNAGDVMVVGATKLTADSWSSVVDDVYNQPTKKRPYYYVHNQNDVYMDEDNILTDRNSEIPTNINSVNATIPSGNATDRLHTTTSYALWMSVLASAETVSKEATSDKQDVLDAATSVAGGNAEMITAINAVGLDTTVTDANGAYVALSNIPKIATVSYNFDRTFNFDENGDVVVEKHSAIEKPAGSRHANSSRVKVEIRCGRDKSNVFSLSAVQIDYVKAPQFIRLTQEQLDSDEDISQVMEFPDYVNQEIINELVNLVMRKTNDPSLQTHI